jgi:uncharacterized protein (TIGR02453 family)
MEYALKFLKKLKADNSREWFDAHKSEYLKARAEFEELIAAVLRNILRFDKDIEKDTTAAGSLFRIYRDVRFSKDKTPYKTHFGASINPGGRRSPEAGYYLHAEPGNCFIAGGVWLPEPPQLAAIRQEIDYHPLPLVKILESKDFKKYFKDLDEEGKLKTIPKGYAKDHPHIGLLKHRNYIVSHTFPDKVFCSSSSVKEITAGLKAMYPFLVYLRSATH